MKFAEAYVDILVRNQQLSSDMAKSTAIAKGGFAKITAMAAKAGAAIAGYLGARMIFRGLQSIVGEAAEADDIMGALEQVLKATGYAAGLSAQQLDAEANRLQKITRFGDETVKQLMTVLATFREVKGDQFIRATSLILDMSVAMGQDARSGAIMLGKALNDPILGVTALSRTGIQFTKSQRDMIKVLVESGRVIEAQNLILNELQAQFGGVAEAAGKRLGGQIAIAKNAFGELKEEMGKAFVEGSDLVNTMNELRDASADGSSSLVDLARAVGYAFDIVKLGLQVTFGWIKVTTGATIYGIGQIINAQEKLAARADKLLRNSVLKYTPMGIAYRAAGLKYDESKNVGQGMIDTGDALAKEGLGGIKAAVTPPGKPDDSMAAYLKDLGYKKWQIAQILAPAPGGGAPGGGAPGGGDAGLLAGASRSRATALSSGLGAGGAGGFELAPIAIGKEPEPASESTQKKLLDATLAVAANTMHIQQIGHFGT